MSHEPHAQCNPIDWQRWANGLLTEKDAQAVLAEMIERLWKAICAVVRRDVKDEHEAEDLTIDIFLRIWQKRTCYDPKVAGLWCWIKNYAIRSEVTLYRNRKARRPVSVCQPNDLLERPLSQRPEEDSPAAHQTEVLDKAVASLGERQEQVINASFDGDLQTDAEIAEHLGMTLGSVKKARHDALKNLKQRIEDINQ